MKNVSEMTYFVSNGTKTLIVCKRLKKRQKSKVICVEQDAWNLNTSR